MTDLTPNNTNDKAIDSARAQSQTYHTPARFKQLQEFVESIFSHHDVTIESLAGDASFRRYHRVYLKIGTDSTLDAKAQKDYDPSYIVMDAPPKLESSESFVRTNLLFATKLNVPNIIAKDLSKGFLILQDFGNTEFADLVADAKNKQDKARIDELYRWAIDNLLKVQDINLDLAKFSFGIPTYDDAMLQREMDLFVAWFLPYIGVTLSPEDQKMWQHFTQALIEEVSKQAKVVVHRDYHSRNLMQDQYNPKALGVIDFQDAVIGTYSYDLVSLLRDAYVELDDAQIEEWIAYYWQQFMAKKSSLICAFTVNQFTEELNLIGVQRHLKILGIFVRLAQRDGKTRYLDDIPKVWRDLMQELTWLHANGTSEVKSFVDPLYYWIAQNVLPIVEKNQGLG